MLRFALIVEGGFDWSAIKNDQVLDYIVNPIKKVSEFPMGLELWAGQKKNTLYQWSQLGKIDPKDYWNKGIS